MNDKHPDNGHDNGSGDERPIGKRSARDRLAAERERLKSREKRRRSLITGGAVLGVLGLAAVAGVLAANADGGQSGSGGPTIAPTGATGEGRLAIPVGRPDAKSTLTVWEDFRCPACKQFESGFRSTIHELVDKGALKVEYHLVTLIDHNMGGSGSLRAANAAACAQEAGRFTPYHDVLYTHQPEETKDAFADNATLVRLAAKVPGLATTAFKKCVESGRHDSWVVTSDRAFTDQKLSGTPTVLLNGRSIYGDPRIQLTPQKLKTMVEEANRQ